MSITTALIPQDTIERLIAAAWATLPLLDTISDDPTNLDSLEAQVRHAEVRDACNAARGALVALELTASRMYVQEGMTQETSERPELACGLQALCKTFPTR